MLKTMRGWQTAFETESGESCQECVEQEKTETKIKEETQTKAEIRTKLETNTKTTRKTMRHCLREKERET